MSMTVSGERRQAGALVGLVKVRDVEIGVVADQIGVGVLGQERVEAAEARSQRRQRRRGPRCGSRCAPLALSTATPGLVSWWKLARRVSLSSTTAPMEMG